MPGILDGLNPEQRAAAAHVDGPLLVFAGAGSGKTRTLTHRIAYLVQECGVSPGSILAVTFTNKAANEMRERVEQLVGPQCKAMWLGTFHSICVRILRRYADRIGYDPNFTIYDEDDRQAVIKRVMVELQLDPARHPVRSLAYRISDFKNDLVLPDEAAMNAEGSRNPAEKLAAAVYQGYQKQLQSLNALDFDDLIMVAVRLLREVPEVLTELQRRFQYVLVDEYQDINQAQYELVTRIAAAQRNLCVVGDDDQSIYGWRGARVEIILQFEDDYPDAMVVKLERNYRSTQAVLAVANAVIANNPERREKALRSERHQGDPVTVEVRGNEQEEAIFVADTILANVRNGGAKYGQHVVLYRTNAQSRIFEQVFGNFRIPYTLVGGVRFYERKEIRDLLAYLRVLHNPVDDVSLQRIINVPARGIGGKTVEALGEIASREGCSLWQAIELASDPDGPFGNRAQKAVAEFARLLNALRDAAASMPVSALVAHVEKQVGYIASLENDPEAHSRTENIDQLRTAAIEIEQQSESGDLAPFLEQMALVSDVDALQGTGNEVVLMTLHAAKGLEFPVVFMVGLEEGIFPHSRSEESPQGVDEERRLCYVGMTRAQEKLFLLRAWRRTLYGQTTMPRPSRFLAEIPEHLVTGAGLTPQSMLPGLPADDEQPFEARRTLSRARLKGRTSSPSTAAKPAASSSPQRSIPIPSGPKQTAWKAGDRVRHGSFGDGIVISCDHKEVQVAFPDQGVKRLALEYAKLERR